MCHKTNLKFCIFVYYQLIKLGFDKFSFSKASSIEMSPYQSSHTGEDPNDVKK